MLAIVAGGRNLGGNVCESMLAIVAGGRNLGVNVWAKMLGKVCCVKSER